MTDTIARLESLNSKRTQGEWEAQEPAFAPNFGKAKIWPLKITGKLYNHPMLPQADAEAICAAMNALPGLLRVARAAERVANDTTVRPSSARDELRKALAELNVG